jgi:CheY-like chemotaxis protein
MQAQRMPANAHFLIYVIDDDDLVRDGLCSLLTHLGHRTESHRNPETALQALLSTDVPPEVVIVDYNMPGMNGAQFIGRYSTAVANNPKYKNTQILLMSGLPPSHFQDFMSEFAQLKLGILEKPFSLDTLRKKLANIHDIRKLSGNLSGILPKVKVGAVAVAADRQGLAPKNGSVVARVRDHPAV